MPIGEIGNPGEPVNIGHIEGPTIRAMMDSGQKVTKIDSCISKSGDKLYQLDLDITTHLEHIESAGHEDILPLYLTIRKHFPKMNIRIIEVEAKDPSKDKDDNAANDSPPAKAAKVFRVIIRPKQLPT